MDNKNNTIAVMKSDTIWIALLGMWVFIIIVILISGVFMMNIAHDLGKTNGRMEEKISALEDVVFVHGLYKKLEDKNEL